MLEKVKQQFSTRKTCLQAQSIYIDIIDNIIDTRKIYQSNEAKVPLTIAFM